MSVSIALVLLAGILIGGIAGVVTIVIIGFIIGTSGIINIYTVDGNKHLYQLDAVDLDKLNKSKFVIFRVKVSEYQDNDNA